MTIHPNMKFAQFLTYPKCSRSVDGVSEVWFFEANIAIK